MLGSTSETENRFRVELGQGTSFPSTLNVLLPAAHWTCSAIVTCHTSLTTGVWIRVSAGSRPGTPRALDELGPAVDDNALLSLAQKHAELANGTSKLVKFRGLSQVVEGAFFVLSGVMVFVAEVGKPEASASGRTKQWLRCIFENGTESSMYKQSLSTRLFEDDGYAVTRAEYDALHSEDEATGYIYVLRSLSDDVQIASIENLYKFGFSRGPVERRIANAEREPTYLMAPLEVVASYRTHNLKTSAREHLLHRVFSEVRLGVNQTGKNGRLYERSEWFVVPLEVIDRAIELITSGRHRGVRV